MRCVLILLVVASAGCALVPNTGTVHWDIDTGEVDCQAVGPIGATVATATLGFLAGYGGMKDLTVREAALRDHALRACIEDVSPAERREIRITSTAPGTIAGCIGDE